MFYLDLHPVLAARELGLRLRNSISGLNRHQIPLEIIRPLLQRLSPYRDDGYYLMHIPNNFLPF